VPLPPDRQRPHADAPAEANDPVGRGALAEVDLGAIGRNLTRIREHLDAGVDVLAAVKANGYGHGSVHVARHLSTLGIDRFGVATAEEALALRAGGVTGEILLFGPAGRTHELIEAGVTLTITDAPSLERIVRSGAAGSARVQLKVDTGMGRLGLPAEAAAAVARAADAVPTVELTGVWTHFARSDEPTSGATEAQLDAFEGLLATLRSDGIEPPLVHAANSAGIFCFPQSHYRLVRPGIALYGYHSSPEAQALSPALEPALTLSAPITFVKRVRAGDPVSYGALWHAPRDTTVATLRIGYADGYPRLLSNRGVARLHGHEVAIAGRVCMDQLLLDVVDLEVAVGDRAVLFGPDGPDAEALAGTIGTISYELLVRLSSRVARIYSGG
jgi:alanine racemase